MDAIPALCGDLGSTDGRLRGVPLGHLVVVRGRDGHDASVRLFRKLLAWWRGDLDPQAKAEADRARAEQELREGESRARDINKPGVS